MPSASEWSSLITPKKWEPKTGKERFTYLATKLAEKWRGGPLPGFSTFSVEQGKLREERAIPGFELEYGVTLQRPGFITDTQEVGPTTIGCSPDGLFDDGSGIEVKCPEPHTHVKYLLAGELPEEYLTQVHGSMLVTGAAKWTFYSYCPGFPSFTLLVHRDERKLEVLREALDTFLGDLQQGWELLCDRNGGPPPKREPFVPVDDVDPRSLLFQGLPGEHDEVGFIG